MQTPVRISVLFFELPQESSAHLLAAKAQFWHNPDYVALLKQTEEILGGKQVNWPFFNCWFLSVPQLLVLLDDVHDVEAFRAVFFSKRAMTLDVADLYYFHSRYGQAQQQSK